MKRFGTTVALLALILLMAPGQIVGAASPYPQATVSTDGQRLNVRRGPSLTYEIIGKAQNGDVYSLLARNESSSWLQIQYGEVESEIGWVSAAFIRTESSLSDLLVSKAESEAPAYRSSGAVAAASNTLAAGVIAVAKGEATGSSPGGRIVFQESSGGAIYVMDGDGSGLRFLTTGMDPALSPDGSQIAFGRWGGAGGLYVVDVDGSNERKVVPGDHIKYPTWSPDGSRIVFNQQIGGGGSTTVVLPWGTFTNVSPDNWRLVVVRTDGTGLQGVPDQPRSFSPSWTDRGVLYATKGSIQRTAPGETTSILYFGNAPLRNPVLSPDGQTILATRFFAGHWEVARLNADGSGLARLIPSKASEHTVAPTWSPDGKQVLFLTDRAGTWQLWSMNADGSNPQPFAPEVLTDIKFKYDFVAEHVVDWR